MKRTASGLEYNLYTKVNPKWDEYDKMVAKSQISRYKKCFFNKDNMVIDDDNEIHEIIENERN